MAEDPWAAFNPQPAPKADPWAAFKPEQPEPGIVDNLRNLVTGERYRQEGLTIPGTDNLRNLITGERYRQEGLTLPGTAEMAGNIRNLVTGERWRQEGFTPVPEAFKDRLKIGTAVQDWAKKIVEGPDVMAGALRGPTDKLREALGEIGEPPTPKASLFPNPLNMAPVTRDLAQAALGFLNAPISAGEELFSRATGIPTDVLDKAMLAIMPARGGLGQFSRIGAAGGELQHQLVGTLPNAEDFQTGAQVLSGANPATGTQFKTTISEQGADAAAQNLRTAWEERGIHPAEAVHDAQDDAFLHRDLVTPDKAPPDKSGIPPVQSTPIVQGTPRAEVARTGEAHIDEILNSAPTQQVINNPIIDRTHSVPYTAGGSVPMEDPTVFIDRRFPTSFTIDGVTFDPADPFVIHENVEQHTMELLLKGGMKPEEAYRVAHFEFAEKAEGAWYRAHGIDQAKAEAAYRPFMERIQHEGAGPSIPAPKRGFVRFFHGGAPLEATEGGPRWLTPDFAYAKGYAEKSGGQVHYVDIPTKSPLLKKVFEDEGTDTKAPFMAFEAPEDVAKNLRPFADAGVPSNLYKRPYPHDNPSAAMAEPFVEAKPTKEEIARAKEILTSRPDQAELEGATGAPERATPAGAEVTRPENLPTLEQQPAPKPGSLVASGRAAIDQLVGLGRNIQYLLDPMATGSKRAMVIAKDAMNSVRRIRWEHARMDAELMNSPELKAARDRLGETIAQQHERMWNAADEESVARQLGESLEHQGLVTLEPEERAFVEGLHARAQAAWLHAVDAGMVEGEGLPAYTPRMVLNVGAGAESLGPQALNELGRNVFTRTAQMRHRKFLTAEETEAAAKEAIAERLAKQGATVDEIGEAVSKVQIGRNIRALPLATARLEEAAVWKEMINKIEDAGKAAGEATVTEGKPKGWFTIEGNPAFTKWKPKLEYDPATGTARAIGDDKGNIIFEPKQLYIAPDFKGPLKAILDQGIGMAEVVPTAPSLYGALMALKGKSMTAILNSPLIHNEVVWSKVMEAAGGREWLGFGLYWKGNRIVEGNPARASELIERGLNPIGPRGAIQDITGIMEQPDIQAGHHESWTGKVLGFIPGLFDAAKGQAVERAIAKAGDFYHNTLLWNRVRDVQFGLADHLSDRLVAGGVDRLTADRVAAHFSNIIVGSIPKEAMSAGARATANLFLFSRSFTLGNLSTFKQAALGLPKPILAQIERDFGMRLEAAVGEAEPEIQEKIAGLQAKVAQDAKSIARRKALSTILLSAGMYYVGNALLQNAFNIAAKDSSVGEELQGYARRFESFMRDVKADPFELRHLIGRLSPVYDNEPTKQDRVHIGYDKDGTAIYARNPTGKFGEEMVGYPTMPLEMIKRKLSPLASGALEVFENDKGFGKKIYDENDKTIGGDVANIIAVAKHLVMRHMPEGQIGSAIDLLRGEGDRTLNALRTFAPVAGFTVSEGAPGGPARGEQLAAKQAFDARFNIAWPDIKKQIQHGDEDGARDALTRLGVPPKMQNGLIRNAQDPAGALHGRTLQDFYNYATPEQIERFERAH